MGKYVRILGERFVEMLSGLDMLLDTCQHFSKRGVFAILRSYLERAHKWHAYLHLVRHQRAKIDQFAAMLPAACFEGEELRLRHLLHGPQRPLDGSLGKPQTNCFEFDLEIYLVSRRHHAVKAAAFFVE